MIDRLIEPIKARAASFRNNERYVYQTKYVLYLTSYLWVMYLLVFFHELGHAISLLSLGGTLHEFVVLWDFTGYVIWSFENVPAASLPEVILLVRASGGIGGALFFMVLSHKSKWFAIPALFSLMDGFAEALIMADTRFGANLSMSASVLIVCLMLFWKFEVGEQDKRRDKAMGDGFSAWQNRRKKMQRKIERVRKGSAMVYDELEELEEVMK